MWEFDAANDVVKRLTDSVKMSDVVASDEAAERARLAAAAHGAGPGPFSDDVVIPAVGVFRLSKTGVLQKILDANLVPTGPERPAVRLNFDLGADGQFADLIGGSFKGAPAIGVVGRRNGNVVFEYLDGTSLRVEWTTTLPPDVSALSLAPAFPDGIAYVSAVKKRIEVSSAANESKALWSLDDLDRDANPYDLRILALQSTN